MNRWRRSSRKSMRTSCEFKRTYRNWIKGKARLMRRSKNKNYPSYSLIPNISPFSCLMKILILLKFCNKIWSSNRNPTKWLTKNDFCHILCNLLLPSHHLISTCYASLCFIFTQFTTYASTFTNMFPKFTYSVENVEEINYIIGEYDKIIGKINYSVSNFASI